MHLLLLILVLHWLVWHHLSLVRNWRRRVELCPGRRQVGIVPRVLSLARSRSVKQVFPQRSTSKPTPKNDLSHALELVRVIDRMLGHFHAAPLASIDNVEAAVGPRVDVLASHQRPNFMVVVPLLQVLAFVGVVVLEREDVVGRPSSVLSPGEVLLVHVVDPVVLTLALFIHELPTLQVSLILLHSITVKSRVTSFVRFALISFHVLIT